MKDRTSEFQTDEPSLDGQSAAPLDAVDRRIVRELTADARLSIRTLAERVHVSRTNVYARLERLLADQVITGFTARVAPHRLGLGTSAIVSLSIEQSSWHEVADRLRAIRYVEHVWLVGGEFDALVLVRTPDNATLRDIVLERIRAVAGTKATRTWLVFDEFDGPGPAA